MINTINARTSKVACCKNTTKNLTLLIKRVGSTLHPKCVLQVKVKSIWPVAHVLYVVTKGVHCPVHYILYTLYKISIIMCNVYNIYPIL